MRSSQELQEFVAGDTIEPRALRSALGNFASGITIISALSDEEPVGFTCQSFYSVSIDPPLISFSVMLESTTYPKIHDAGKFAVNVLSYEQQAISNQFARTGTDKWAGVSWRLTRNDNPIIDDTLMWLDCDLFEEYEAGDHYIVLGHVNEISPVGWSNDEPLVFFQGRYRQLLNQ